MVRLVLVEGKSSREKSRILDECDLIVYRYYDGRVRMFAVFLNGED